MRTKFSGILTLIMAFAVQLTFAQEKTVTGTVTDAESGLPLAGVNIVIEGTTTGTQTDFDGNYSIEASQGQTLVFSYVGYADESVTVDTDTATVDVGMSASASELEQIIVTAIGIEREKSSLGSSTTTVLAEDLNEASQPNIGSALKGKIAGVQITGASTDPGASQGIVIRGIKSTSASNQPLFVVDGVPLNNGSSASTDLNGGYDFGRGYQDINPQDIESVTVLKGASASALYGNRGANGVIVITTKSGKAGKLIVNLSSTTTFTKINRTPNYQSTFGQGWDGLHYLAENGSWGPRFDGKDRVWGNVVNNSQKLKPYSFQEDQLENFFTTGTSFLNTAAISGGNENTTARISYSNLRQDGIYPTDADSFERNTLGLSAESKMGSLSISGNLNYVNNGGSAVATGQGLTVYNNLMQIPTDIPITEFEDYNDPFNNVSNYFTPYGVTNPYFTLNENGTDYNEERVYGSFQLKVDINDWSHLLYRFGLDQSSSVTRQWEAIVEAAPGSPNDDTSTEFPGSYSELYTSIKQLDHNIQYGLDIDVTEDLNLYSTTGFNINSQESEVLLAEVGDQIIPDFYSLDNSSAQPNTTNAKSLEKNYGLYNSTTLGFKNQLFLTGNIRHDWYSTLPKENNTFLYGGANVSWVFTRTFEGLENVINYGKLRGGYGVTGVDTAPYLTTAVFVPGNTDNQGFASLTFPLGGVLAYEVGNRAENQDLKPEVRKEMEVGIDLEFFENRIGLSFTYYDSDVENQILSLPLAPSTGYTNQTANLGTISNKGIEALLTFSPFRNKDGFSWDAALNFTKNNSELVELDPRLESAELALGGLSTISLVAKVGEPLFLLEGPVPATTEDGRIIVDAFGVPVASDEKEIYGDTEYDYTLGINNTLSYKNLSLGFTFDIREGGLMFSRTADITRFTGNSIVTTYNDREPFVVPNSVQEVDNGDGTVSYIENTVPVDKAHQDDYYRAAALGRQTVIDKSFIKLREVVLSYKLPEKLLRNSPLDMLSFSLVGRNLFIWTPEDNQFIDPEVSTFGSDLESQFGEFSANPTTRSIGLSINTTF